MLSFIPLCLLPRREIGASSGQAVIDPEKKDGHMRYAGSVNLAEATFGAVAHDVALSAISADFKNVVLMCDHGGEAQSQLEKVAKKMDKEWAPRESTCTTFRTCTTKRKI
jgi:creatinine amidohydrolase/Fe(II)-dependent formamide hydrolase-like protein